MKRGNSRAHEACSRLVWELDREFPELEMSEKCFLKLHFRIAKIMTKSTLEKVLRDRTLSDEGCYSETRETHLKCEGEVRPAPVTVEKWWLMEDLQEERL